MHISVLQHATVKSFNSFAEDGRAKPKSVRFVGETETTPEAAQRMPDLAHQLPGLDPDSVYVVSGAC
jgi:hypothetical protein